MHLSSNGQRKIAVCLLFFIANLALTKRTNANDSKTLITKMCLLSVDSEMALAEKQPPQGMADFTCKCFFNNVSKGYSIKSSKEKCKTEASRKFNLEKG